MSFVLKCGLAVLAVASLVLVAFLKMQTPKSKKKRKINNAMKSIHAAVKDIASMVR